MKRSPRSKRLSQPIAWLPVDSRLFSPILSFGHVRGVAKAFLIAEMALALGSIFGTIILVLLAVLF